MLVSRVTSRLMNRVVFFFQTPTHPAGYMTSVDPSHIPTSKNDSSRGQAIVKRGALRIPDLRFEQSYISSLQRGVHLQDSRTSRLFVKEDGDDTNSELYGAPLSLDWKHILYVTFRDQLFSPFLQGAALAMATWYLRPFLRTLGARIRTHVSSTWLSILKPRVFEERSWVKEQIKDIGTHGVSTNIALAR